MANKKVSRRALFTSVISLILCCAMLMGTTFAWFTDEVKSANNIIKSGNLDVKLLANGVEVDANTKLFDNVELWEPGMVVYENLQVVNAGNLALKYQMTLNFGNENDLNGHKLSEVLKVVVLDKKIEDGTLREDVLADAKKVLADAENEQSKGMGALSNFYQTGNLEAGKSSVEQAVVIFWDAKSAEIDNLYNVNNGKITSDGKPLHIEFGVNLQATQQMNEKDSFGSDYDQLSSILPKATVNNTGVKTVDVFMGYNEETIELDTSFQFLPNEQLNKETGELDSEYKDWHADFVVVADNDVAADSMALAGYYKAWCGENGWVVLSVPAIAAGKEVRLVASMDGITVSYEEICQYGNDGLGFMCGAADLTGTNDGTTITVELRMYETDANEGALSSLGSETGHYEVIGRFTHTFGGSWATMEDGTQLFKEPDGDVVLYDTQSVTTVDYKVPAGVTHLGNYSLSYNTTIESVTLPTSVVDLGRAFDSNRTIETVVLNEGLETISSRAFKATTALEKVIISSTVKTIADEAFQKTGLKTITIPANVEYVGAQAFGASNIETVTFEGNTTIQNKAFRGCSALHTVCLNGDDITFENTTGQANCWFCNSESNNPGVSNIAFHVKNEKVAAKVLSAMGADTTTITIFVNGTQYHPALQNP